MKSKKTKGNVWNSGLGKEDTLNLYLRSTGAILSTIWVKYHSDTDMLWVYYYPNIICSKAFLTFKIANAHLKAKAIEKMMKIVAGLMAWEIVSVKSILGTW